MSKFIVKEIKEKSGHIDRNHIKIGSVIEFKHQDDTHVTLFVNGKDTTTVFDKHGQGKFKKLFDLKEID